MSLSTIKLRRLQPTDPDLAAIATELNASDSEVDKRFTDASLRDFLRDPERFYLLAYAGDHIAGATHGYVLHHPAGAKYLYIDEVDTMEQYRRRGVGRLMMEEAFRIGREHGCTEAWLGTEHNNEPAKALYLSLSPAEIENGPIYTWKLTTTDPNT